MAVFATLNITSSDWCGRHWPSASAYCGSLPTSSGRCASSCHTTRGLRPAWMLRLGLFLYDHLARLQTLPGSASLRLQGTDLGAPLQPRLTRGFAYSDCWVEDSRLVVLNAMDARERGAEIRTRTAVESAHRDETSWVATIRDVVSGRRETVRAGMVVNAAGPWVSETLGRTLGLASRATVRLVKGSHIVVKRLYDGAQAYILQQPDGRIVFAIPYERDFTLIGTTDVPHGGSRARSESPRTRPAISATASTGRSGLGSAPTTWCGASRACARSSTMPPRMSLRSLATTSSMSRTAMAACPCSRSMAARSPLPAPRRTRDR